MEEWKSRHGTPLDRLSVLGCRHYDSRLHARRVKYVTRRIGGFAVLARAATGLQLPSFDDNSSFLWLLGLSHAAYLAYKAPTKKPA